MTINKHKGQALLGLFIFFCARDGEINFNLAISLGVGSFAKNEMYDCVTSIPYSTGGSTYVPVSIILYIFPFQLYISSSMLAVHRSHTCGLPNLMD